MTQTCLLLLVAWLTIAGAALPTPDDLRVHNLEETEPAFGFFRGQMFAGSLPMDHGENEEKRTGFLQFWLFVPDQTAAPNTMVSWFNGGPGCSSFSTGLLFEHGPVTVPPHPAAWCCEAKDAPLQYNPYGWTNATVMLYVEQPIGVGFSYATQGTPPPASEQDVAADFDAFLQNFYRIFDGGSQEGYDPSLDLRTHKLYLVGESYAGIYIPSIARGIYLNNNNQAKDRFLKIPLAGMAIGNGEMDHLVQNSAVIDFCYWHGLIDGPTRDTLKQEWEHCIAQLNHNNAAGNMEADDPAEQPEPFHPFTIRDDCGVLSAILLASGEDAFDKLPEGLNVYEYSTWDPYAADGENGTISAFYNNRAVQKALHVPAHQTTWLGCIPEAAEQDVRRRLLRTKIITLSNRTKSRRLHHYRDHHHLFTHYMDHDTPWSVIPYVAQLLDEAQIDVLIYSGDRDILCCSQGTEEALAQMAWSGTLEAAVNDTVVDATRNAWSQAPRGLWIYNESYPAGYIKSHKNLSLLTVYNAGHMVPYNQPGPALDMITRFLTGESFYDRPLPSFSTMTRPLRKGDSAELSSKQPLGEEAKDKDATAAAVLGASITGGQYYYGSSGGGDRLSTPAPVTNINVLVLMTCLAFVLGYGVARMSTVPSYRAQRLQQQQQHVVVRGGYGSISMRE